MNFSLWWIMLRGSRSFWSRSFGSGTLRSRSFGTATVMSPTLMTATKMTGHDATYVACWQHLRELYIRYEKEQSSQVKMSMLTDVAAYPKVVERLRVQPCLNVFGDNTAVALQLFREKTQTDVRDTVLLLQTVTKWCEFINVKQKGLDERLREPLHSVISDANNPRIIIIIINNNNRSTQHMHGPC